MKTVKKDLRSKYLGNKFRVGWVVAGVENTSDSGNHKRFFLEKTTKDGLVKHFSCTDNTMTKLSRGETTVAQLIKNKEFERKVMKTHPHRNDVYYSYKNYKAK